MYRVVLVDKQHQIQQVCKDVESPTTAILWHDLIASRSKGSLNGFLPAIESEGQLYVGSEIHILVSGVPHHA